MLNLPDPDSCAKQVLAASGLLELPIDVNVVASTLPGLEVVEDDLDGDGLFCDLGIHGGQILIKRGAHPMRKKFTLAHEIGHFVIRGHAPLLSSQGRKTPRNLEIERWCNQFAASLLMPKDLVLSYLRSAKLSGILDAICLGPAKFNVSDSAFRSRVAEITPTSIYGFFPKKHKSKRDSAYLSDVKETHWKSDYNKILSRMSGENESPDIRRFGQLILVNGWTHRQRPALDREFIFLILQA